jgi:hypothetical protein
MRRKSVRFGSQVLGVQYPHEIGMPYRMPMVKRITLPLAARPVNGPMSISAL